MNQTFRFALAFATLGLAGAAAAQVKDYALFRTHAYVQTGATSVALDGSFLSAKIDVTDANDFAGASLNGEAMSLDPTDPTAPLFTYASNYFATSADLEAAFPYPASFNFATDTGLRPGGSATLEDRQVRFSADVPVIPEYAALQGIRPGTRIDLSIAAFAAGAGTDTSLISYQVLDLTTSSSIANGVNANAPFALSLSGADLLPGHDYSVTVVYSGRQTGKGNGFGGAPFTLGYDNRTDFTFSVSPVPEPSAWAALGLGAVVVLRRRRRA